ncbi:hybrid sensor histidine kinase/response regulator transcription factor [Draconibacterium halophilum]|uniref:histidine kinase n=1 Tax=Draconibacterium halophilum TaxID=2706887 RepID=A0A6C0REX4_9BACT|nr:hybrid sensor histidine kinase/response regulator transcription factor [Draconibacterium halophilum]QIA08083.1 response regulator [Draconibacterium halophilum]
MNSRQYYFFQFVFLALNCLAFVAAAENSIQFYNLNEEYGISIRETNQVCEDDDGFIWISSKVGIVRYSRDDIRTYQLPYDSEDIITVRMEYTNHTLYAYTNNGQVFEYNEIQDRFDLITNITKQLENPHVTINKMLVDSTGTIWEASTFGLMSFNHEEGLNIYFNNQNIHYIEWLDNHRFLYGIDGSLGIFDINTLNAKEYYRFPEGSNFYISYIEFDKAENTLWLGTFGDGLYCLKEENSRQQLLPIPDIPNQPIQAISPISESSFLVGVDGQGVWEVDKNSFEVIAVYKDDSDNPNSLKGNGVYDIFCDRNQRVWICTYSGGVSFFDQASSSVVTKISHSVNNPNSLVNNDVNSVIEDRNGNLWFATNNGVSFWNTKTNNWRSFYHNKEQHAQVFLALYEDSFGRIWAGSYSSGIYILDGNTGKELRHLSQENKMGDFAGDFVFNMLEDQQGDIWIGGVRGDLIRYNYKSDTFQSYPDYTIYLILEYGPDKLLMGTTYGLLLFDKITGNHEVLVEGFVVSDLYLSEDMVWIATNGNGVIRYNLNNKSTQYYTIDNGLPSNFVNTIEYAKGYYWIGTELGLCRLNEADQTVLTFNSLLYLSNVSFNQDAHYTLKNGDLIMGSNNGALMFDPDDLKFMPEDGQIYVQDISVSGRSIREIEDLKPEVPINELKEINLKYFQNTISLELIPLGVTSPGAKFSWKIDGLDEEWSKPVDNRILSYSNIPYGTYTIHLRMVDNSITGVIAERQIKVQIVPPFWKTIWFNILVLLFVAGLGIFSIYFYVDRLKKKHSEEKIRFFANTAHDIRTSLTLVNGPIEELNKESGLSDKGSNYLHLATEQVHRLSKVVTQLLDFQKVDIGKERMAFTSVDIVKMVEDRVMMFESHAKSRGIDLVFKANCRKFETSVDERMIQKVIDNLISNGIKYSNPNSRVKVKLKCAASKWTIEVKDNGIGITKKAQKMLFREYYRGDNAINSKIVGSGIGLLLVKNYVTLHGGKVTCESQSNVGSTFTVTIPLINKDDSARKKETTRQSADKNLFKPSKINPVTEKQAVAKRGNKMTVLIVEDHEYLREFLQSAMQDQFNVYMAEDGEMAWDMIQKQHPDLIVSDIMMPKMDGFTLCEKVKSNFLTAHIPVILLTALAGKAQQLHGLGIGADDYLTKPFDVTLLQQRIKSILKNREIVRNKALKLTNADEEPILLENELNDKFLKRMIEVVTDNMDNSQFSKNEFAASMNVSPSLLYKKIKALTDQSPTDFIKTIRLNHARDLLHSKKYTITEVSELCGFSSVGYFSTVFRKHFGKSPTQMIE